MYKKNPKVHGSGILCAIPQSRKCPVGCRGCFFQGGRSYLEPLEDNLPNLPELSHTYYVNGAQKIVRVNDGNDSNVDRKEVVEKTREYESKFYNTSIPKDLESFDAPVVLTLNPAKMTDTDWHRLEEIPNNLMFVRVRINSWNIETVVEPAIKYYTERKVPVILTWMAYDESTLDTMPKAHKVNYVKRVRTTNTYYAIRSDFWLEYMKDYAFNHFVYSCGKAEGELGNTKCERCGHCIREWNVTMQRLTELA